jgi:hypothetical protein
MRTTDVIAVDDFSTSKTSERAKWILAAEYFELYFPRQNVRFWIMFKSFSFNNV